MRRMGWIGWCIIRRVRCSLGQIGCGVFEVEVVVFREMPVLERRVVGELGLSRVLILMAMIRTLDGHTC